MAATVPGDHHDRRARHDPLAALHAQFAPILPVVKLAAKRLNADEPHRALLELDPLFETAPFGPVVRDAIVVAVEKIIAIETDRGEIAPAARSALAPAAQPFQDFIDECFFRLAGLTPAEVTGLKLRYQAMKKVK